MRITIMETIIRHKGIKHTLSPCLRGAHSDPGRHVQCRKSCNLFAITFMIVIAGAPGAGYVDKKTPFLHGIQSDIYYNDHENMHQDTHTLLHSEILGTVQGQRNFSFHPSAIDKLSDMKREMNTDKFASFDNLWGRKMHEYPRTTYLTVAINGTNSEDEYFLGYSSNMFGSHNKYIEELRKDGGNQQARNGQTRKKRSVLHLYNMVLCATGCNPLSYKGYGCYCGFLGSGYVVDGIDRCCKIHDWCYDVAGCPMFLEYFIPYLWKCYNRHPLCALDHGDFGGPGSCAQRLCECDRQLAQCLRKYPCPGSKALCTSSPWRLLQNIFMN